MQHVRAVVFDAYGTLLDIHAAMGRYAARLGPNWQQISADWRMKQLEYSWVRSLAGPGHHRDFWHLTEEALVWAASRHGIHDAQLLAEILMAYRHLDAYPEVPVVLRLLRDKGLERAILSNAEPGMLRDAVHTAGLTDLLNAVLSVESVGVFKPDPRVYRLAGRLRAVSIMSSSSMEAAIRPAVIIIPTTPSARIGREPRKPSRADRTQPAGRSGSPRLS